ncbi:MAG: T9SS type A sorting domain-containing protein [Bacteroidetes bacterium]|nr:T9SS type A sorting domain-containing protein [Bacteroidota bacterium]
MKTMLLIVFLLFPSVLTAQRGDIILDAATKITVPDGAEICADRIYADSSRFGTLLIANRHCICDEATVLGVRPERLPARPVLQVYPSPCDDVVTLRYHVHRPSVVRVMLTDALGRVIRTVQAGKQHITGWYSLRISTAALPSGLYGLLVDTSAGRQYTPVLVRR